MIPKQPPKRTATRPGIGVDGVRLDSAELKKVRETFERDLKSDPPADFVTPPPSSRARVPREDDDVPPESVPRSDRFITAAGRREEAAKREPHPATRPRPAGSPPVARQQTAVGLGNKVPSRPGVTSSEGAGGSPMPSARTVVGLGSKTHPQSHQQSRPTPPVPEQSAARVVDDARIDARVDGRRTSDAPISRPPASKGRWSSEEAPSGPRSRKPLTVDAVGDTATRIARNTRQTAPKVVASPATIASAPLDSRSAFVLSLVDGGTEVPAIVDATGMPSDEVIGILARLARLGLISVP